MRQAITEGKTMPLIQKPITDTIGYTFETAMADAKRYVEAYPLESQPEDARIFMHAMISYFGELGVGREERDRILGAWTTASLTTWQRAFDIGWDKAREYAARVATEEGGMRLAERWATDGPISRVLHACDRREES